MRVEYGDAIFKKWFEFDNESCVWGNDNFRCYWNGIFRGDTISGYDIVYRFHFPGCGVSTRDVYYFELDSKGKPTSAHRQFAFANHADSMITTTELRLLCEQHLNKRLDKCYATLWLEPWYSIKDSFESVKLDSTHAYIEVHDYKCTGGDKWGDHFEVVDTKMLVDAFTGKFVGLGEFSFEGTVGEHF